PVLSPDLEIEQLAARGLLPEGTACAYCGTATAAVVTFRATCARAWVEEPENPYLLVAFVGVLGLFAGLLSRQRREARQHGRDVVLPLPLRLCHACRPLMADAATLTETLRRTPVYARLLDKYPEATIVLDLNWT